MIFSPQGPDPNQLILTEGLIQVKKISSENSPTRVKSQRYHNLPTQELIKLNFRKKSHPKSQRAMPTVSPAKTSNPIPATPESSRRKKKQRDRDLTNLDSSTKKNRPIKSPTKENKDDMVSTRTRSSEKKTKVSAPKENSPSQYVKLNPSIDDEDIKKMTKSNLTQEIGKIAKNRNIALPKDVIMHASKTALIRRAIAFKRLSKPLKKSPKK